MTDETLAGLRSGNGRQGGRLPAKRRSGPDTLIVFSHLRWNFVFQRPQHLLSRAARSYRVLFFEEPVLDGALDTPMLERTKLPSSVERLVPHLKAGSSAPEQREALKKLVSELVAGVPQGNLIGWYYTPMALTFSQHIPFTATVYDCMDELSAFKNAPQSLRQEEERLLTQADLVFTGGLSLYEAKRERHPSVHAYPSSVDRAHFEPARKIHAAEPADIASIPHPRVGYFGVVDERIDYDLLAATAEAMPHIQFVMIGPTAKVDAADLPQRPNIHWLGSKAYAELPAYLAAFDTGLMPFAISEATRFISPTKTPEFLAAGVPVVSTPIIDVVRTYRASGTIAIAHDLPSMMSAIETQLAIRSSPQAYRAWLTRADGALSAMSWDTTWTEMNVKVRKALAGNQPHLHEHTPAQIVAARHV